MVSADAIRFLFPGTSRGPPMAAVAFFCRFLGLFFRPVGLDTRTELARFACPVCGFSLLSCDGGSQVLERISSLKKQAGLISRAALYGLHNYSTPYFSSFSTIIVFLIIRVYRRDQIQHSNPKAPLQHKLVLGRPCQQGRTKQ